MIEEITYNGKKFMVRYVYFSGDNDEQIVAEEALGDEGDDSKLEWIFLDNNVRFYVPREVLYWDDDKIEEYVLKHGG